MYYSEAFCDRSLNREMGLKIGRGGGGLHAMQANYYTCALVVETTLAEATEQGHSVKEATEIRQMAQQLSKPTGGTEYAGGCFRQRRGLTAALAFRMLALRRLVSRRRRVHWPVANVDPVTGSLSSLPR